MPRHARKRSPAADDSRKPTRGERRESRRPAREAPEDHEPLGLKRLLPTKPLNPRQADYQAALQKSRVVLATGPAGTAKTYISVCHALDGLASGQYERLLFLRPTVEAGASLGFLPGDLSEKLSPYFEPIRKSAAKKIGSAAFAARWLKSALENGTIVFGSIQHLRGDTLTNTFAICDEAQNCTYSELKLIVTRLGEGSAICFAGDLDQDDLPEGQSGFREFVARLRPLRGQGIALTEFTEADVVRDPLLKLLLPYL